MLLLLLKDNETLDGVKQMTYNRSAQHSTAQHSTAQHSTAQHSTAQHQR
ncbi:adenine methyltransferase [Lactococcus formosensis]|nr:adenine methyltransferase [Lactococcus formosensis]MDG6116108.1 adenine methyltransferase [Lactococcus formosensis]